MTVIEIDNFLLFVPEILIIPVKIIEIENRQTNYVQHIGSQAIVKPLYQKILSRLQFVTTTCLLTSPLSY